MSITKIDFLEDRVEVHYHLDKPYGVPDVDSVSVVQFERIGQLEKVSENERKGCPESVFVPGMKKTITYFFYSYQERCMGPNEEDMYGPYLDDTVQG